MLLSVLFKGPHTNEKINVSQIGNVSLRGEKASWKTPVISSKSVWTWERGLSVLFGVLIETRQLFRKWCWRLSLGPPRPYKTCYCSRACVRFTLTAAGGRIQTGAPDSYNGEVGKGEGAQHSILAEVWGVGGAAGGLWALVHWENTDWKSHHVQLYNFPSVGCSLVGKQLDLPGLEFWKMGILITFCQSHTNEVR